VAEVRQVGVAEHLGELLAQANLHLVFNGINAVFGQPAGFDVAIQQNHLMARLRDLLRREQARRTRAHNEHSFHAAALTH